MNIAGFPAARLSASLLGPGLSRCGGSLNAKSQSVFQIQIIHKALPHLEDVPLDGQKFVIGSMG